MKEEILYVFGGQKAQGAEIVIERLMDYNSGQVNAHLFIAPGKFADKLIASNKPYKITCLNSLKKLNRSKTSRFTFYFKALIKYASVSYSAYRYIKTNHIYTIHANTIVPASYLLPLILFSKIFLPARKWLWSDHDMKYFAWLDLLLSKWCLQLYDRTLTVSLAVKEKYPASEKIAVLYNGLDMGVFKQEEALRSSFRSGLNISTNTRVLGIAASICPGKGQLALIAAFKNLTNSHPDSLLLIAGNYADDDQHYNEKVRKSISANPKIIHLGFVEDMLAFYNACDIVISNSDLKRSESLGTTIYEAMSCERIVIASKTGGAQEIITSGKDGYLYEADNSNALEATLRHVFNHSALNDGITIAARTKVAERFDIFKMVTIYNGMISALHQSVILDGCDRHRDIVLSKKEEGKVKENTKQNALYIFGGEKAQGAEIVIERLMDYNADKVNAHLFIAPGAFAHRLLRSNKGYKITLVNCLKKLNRSSTGALKYYLFAVKNYLTLPYLVYRYIRRNDIGLIHSNTVVPSSYLIPLVIFSKLFMPSTKWIWSDHDLRYYSKLDHFLSYWCARLFDYTLVVSEAVKSKFSAGENLIVLYNGLDADVFKPSTDLRDSYRERNAIRGGEIVFGIVAVVDPSKGQLELIEAFAELSKHYSNIKLYMAGGFAQDSKDYGNSVKSEVKKSADIFHVGYINDMIGFYNGCDIIISNSTEEPLGTNIYEAMACEKIVLASDSGGTPEIISDKIDGFLFNTGDIPDLLSKMEYAVLNYNDLGELRRQARKKVKERFNIYGMVSRYNEILFNSKSLKQQTINQRG